MYEIPGTPLLGFGDFFVGAKKPAGKTARKPSSAKSAMRRVALAKGSYAKGNVAKKALGNALKAGNRAKAIATKSAQRLAKYKQNVNAGKHSPLVPLKVTKVQGDGCVVVGAAGPKDKKSVRKELTPKQKSAVAKHNKAIAANFKANRKAAKAVKKAVRAAKKANTLVKKNAKFFGKAFAGKATKTQIRGELLGVLEPVALSSLHEEEAEFLGTLLGEMGVDEALDIIGDMIGEDEGGSEDAGGGAAAAAADKDEGDEGDDAPKVVRAPNGKVLYDPKKDPDVVPIPKRGEKLAPEKANKTWDKVPEGAIVVPATPASGDIGSYSLVYTGGPSRQGFEFVAEGGGEAKWYLIGYDFHWDDLFAKGQDIGTGGRVIRAERKSGKVFPTERIPGEFFGREVGPTPSNQLINQLSQSGRLSAGPIVGNPNSQKFAGAMYASADDKFFWLPENAPTWATADIDAKIAETNAATMAANTAAAEAIAAEMEAEITAKKEEEEKKKAEEALAAKKAEEEKQKTEEAERKEERGLELEQEKLRLEIARKESEVDAAAGRALVEQAQIWNEYAKKNPEAAMAAMKQQQAAPAEGEGGEGEGGEGEAQTAEGEGEGGGSEEAVGWGGPLYGGMNVYGDDSLDDEEGAEDDWNF